MYTLLELVQLWNSSLYCCPPVFVLSFLPAGRQESRTDMLVKVNKVEKTCMCGFGLIYLWSGSEGIVMLTPIPILLKIKSYFFYKFVESVFSAFNLMFRIKINYEWSLTLLLDVGYGLRPAAVQIWHWITGKILYIVKDIVKCLQYIVECLYL